MSLKWGLERKVIVNVNVVLEEWVFKEDNLRVWGLK